MGMTITEKILAAHCGQKEVKPGEFINAKVDVLYQHDYSLVRALPIFQKIGVDSIFDRGKLVVDLGHLGPSSDIEQATGSKRAKEFVKSQGITHCFEIGRAGIAHILLPDEGLILPGDIAIGGDSHATTCGALGCFSMGLGLTDQAVIMALGEVWLKVPKSMKFIYTGKRKEWVMGKDLILHTIGDIGDDGALYQAMEFTGEVITDLPMDDRFSMCCMAFEAGAKNAVIAPDEVTLKYVRPRAQRPYAIYQSDEDAEYASIHEYNVSQLEPQVACPFLPSNTKPVSEVDKVTIDQVFVGTCTNGSLTDLRVVAKVLQGKKVHPDVRLLVIPATQRVFLQAVKEGLAEVIMEAGGSFGNPSCGPCGGGHMGVLGEGERCVSTSPRNFVGRMGHSSSEIYLANPAVAAASAIKGRIASPEEVV